MNISSIEGCRGLSTLDTVNIHPKPDASFAPVKGDATCILDSIMLRANIQSSAYLYVWQPAHFFDNSNNFEVWGQIEFPGYVTLTVTDPYGCYNSDSVEFNPGECCIVSFPSAFTPNGDGKNDYFRPLYKGFHRFHEFRVENRWGETVFQTNSSTVEWDGTHNGVPQDLGVYFYYLKFDCGGGAREVRGDVTLIR